MKWETKCAMFAVGSAQCAEGADGSIGEQIGSRAGTVNEGSARTVCVSDICYFVYCGFAISNLLPAE